jgi:hypothetical protein
MVKRHARLLSAWIGRTPFLLCASFLLCLSLLFPTIASAKTYVDARLGDLKAEDTASITAPKPVQFIFQFQRAGAANARAATYAKPIFKEAILARSVFSELSDAPSPNYGLLSVTMNNIPQANAASQGFTAGLTLGLAGTVVTDFYEIKFEYLPVGATTPIVKTISHAIHTKIGRKAGEAPGIEVRNIDAAIRMVIAQAAAHGVNQLIKDGGVSGSGQMVPPPAAPAATALPSTPALLPTTPTPTVPAPAPPAAPK